MELISMKHYGAHYHAFMISKSSRGKGKGFIHDFLKEFHDMDHYNMRDNSHLFFFYQYFLRKNNIQRYEQCIFLFVSRVSGTEHRITINSSEGESDFICDTVVNWIIGQVHHNTIIEGYARVGFEYSSG